ncbi:hypothetical protein HN51_011650 [Arachis hypogaea]
MANSLDVATAHCDGTTDNVFGSDDGIAELPMEEGESSNLSKTLFKSGLPFRIKGSKLSLKKKFQCKKNPLLLLKRSQLSFTIKYPAMAAKRACPEKTLAIGTDIGRLINRVFTTLSVGFVSMWRNSNMNPLPSQNDQSMMQLTTDNYLEPILIDQSEKSQDLNDQSMMQLTANNHLEPILIDQSKKVRI